MKILFEIIHPKSVHIFKYIIKDLIKKGHNVKVASVNKDITLRLLKYYRIEHDVILNLTGKGYIQKILLLLYGIFKFFLIFIQFKPDITIGRASPMMAINSWIFRKKHYSLSDTEHVENIHKLSKLISYKIITPDCFKIDLGIKQEKISSYLELAYLHPNRFTPNPEVLKEIGLKDGDVFFILRFVSWGASHDIGQKGLSDDGKRKLIDYLKVQGKIIITSESQLPKEFEEYRMSISPTKIHDLLYYATMYVGEGGTMASESACLGTPAIYVNTLTMGYIQELENKYGLLFRITKNNSIIEKAQDILNSSQTDWIKKRQKLLNDKIEMNDVFYKIIF
jgi:predicted glycosyltransferase